MKILKDVFYTEEEVASKILDVYLPEGDPDAVFLYMHGGGLVAEDKDNAGALIGGYLAAHNIAFVTINYSMYPNAQYPDYMNSLLGDKIIVAAYDLADYADELDSDLGDVEEYLFADDDDFEDEEEYED